MTKKKFSIKNLWFHIGCCGAAFFSTFIFILYDTLSSNYHNSLYFKGWGMELLPGFIMIIIVLSIVSPLGEALLISTGINFNKKTLFLLGIIGWFVFVVFLFLFVYVYVKIMEDPTRVFTPVFVP